jgi:hypothetical protein
MGMRRELADGQPVPGGNSGIAEAGLDFELQSKVALKYKV